jgi:hypothetical protein
MRDCAVCHLPGIAGAPKVGDKAEWSRRVRAGLGMVYRNALEGIPNTAMGPKGGQTDLSDDEVRAIVDYMIAAAALEPHVLEAAKRYDRFGITDRDFVRFDANYDGFLSQQELKSDAVLVRNFGRFDENRDEKLSPAEFRRAETILERERIAANVDDASLARGAGGTRQSGRRRHRLDQSGSRTGRSLNRRHRIDGGNRASGLRCGEAHCRHQENRRSPRLGRADGLGLTGALQWQWRDASRPK